MQIDLTKPVSQVTFAQLVGVGPRTVTQLLARGVIQRGGTAGDWLKAYASHLREVAASRQTADGKLDLVAERAKLTVEQRKVTEIKRRELEGALVDIAEVRREFSKHIAVARDAYLALPARMAPVVVGQSIHRIQALLDAEIRHTMNTLAEALGAEPK